MLKSLTVENYALIDHLELDLSESLNIITGETGAGKSIILGALGLLLGARADVGVVRDMARNCVVEGAFDLSGYALEGVFEENELDYADQTTIRRVVAPTGKSRAYINDLPVQQATLKELSARLLDIHSQHQSLMLAEDGFRVAIVDSTAGNAQQYAEYRAEYDKLRSVERKLVDTQELNARGAQEKEWLEYQVSQLREAQLRAGEQEELEAEQAELAHAEEIKTAISENVARLDGENLSIVAELKSAKQTMSAIAEYYPRAEEFAARLDSALIELRDMERELAAEAERVESDPARLEYVDARLATIYSLQQKHHADSLAQLLDIQADYESRLAAITSSDEAVEALRAEGARRRAAAEELASKLTATRRRAAAEVSSHVEKTAAALGMPAAKFVVEISPAALKPSGADEIKFLFTANKNIAPAPVEKIASGGETSRIMLSLKSLAAHNRSLPTIIFDEIDTGVSGPVADAMGRIIEQLAGSMQVVDITHLPQVASKGDTHFVVYKDGESRTRIRRLTPDERIEEIAKMLSGQAVTPAAREQAKLLLGDKK
jgi:DNA repair protein RecN (Recombination protein N)